MRKRAPIKPTPPGELIRGDVYACAFARTIRLAGNYGRQLPKHPGSFPCQQAASAHFVTDAGRHKEYVPHRRGLVIDGLMPTFAAEIRSASGRQDNGGWDDSSVSCKVGGCCLDDKGWRRTASSPFCTRAYGNTSRSLLAAPSSCRRIMPACITGPLTNYTE